MAASPFETPPCGWLLRVRPHKNFADFLILRATPSLARGSVSKDEEIPKEPNAIPLKSSAGRSVKGP